MTIKGVVFDFNGTLFWDTKLHNEAWDIHGKNNKDIISSLFPGQLAREEISELSIEKERNYQKIRNFSEVDKDIFAKD